MLRRWPLPLALAGLLAVPASAANQNVRASGVSFSPANFTLEVGDTATWDNKGGTHNVKFDDGSFEQPAAPSSTPWSVSRGFDSAGTYRYHCELHGGPGGAGMSGTVTVVEPGSRTEDFTISTEADRTQKRRKALKFGIRLDEFECSQDCEFTIRLKINRRTARRLDLGKRPRTVGRTEGFHTARFGPKRVDVRVTSAFSKAVKGRPRDERIKLKVVPSARDAADRAERAKGHKIKIKLVP